MPPTSSPALAEILAGMFALSAEKGAGVHRRLTSGLHVKVALRGGKRLIIVWRDGDRLPSGKECEVVGEDAGLIRPTFRTWQCREAACAFLITDAFTGTLCDHTWGFTAHFDEKKASGYTSTCTACAARWRRSTPRRGSQESFFYNGVKVRASVFERWRVRGPVPDATATPTGIEADLALADRAFEELRQQQAAQSLTGLRGEVCGLCRHGEPEEGGLVACALGWAAHDGCWSEREKTFIAAGHPGVPLPLLTPGCRCMALGRRWLPRTVAA